jgi:hypothetical protein
VAMLSFGLMGSVVSIDKVSTSQEARVATAPQCHARVSSGPAAGQQEFLSFFIWACFFFTAVLCAWHAHDHDPAGFNAVRDCMCTAMSSR